MNKIELINPRDIKLIKNGNGEFPDTYELTQQGLDTIVKNITRLEVINHQDNPLGKAYSKQNCQKIELSLQDDNRTLKIFITKNP